MNNELMKLPNGEELTREQLIERESYLESTPANEGKLRYIGFNLLALVILIIIALICPKCSDASDRAIGLPANALEGGAK